MVRLRRARQSKVEEISINQNESDNNINLLSENEVEKEADQNKKNNNKTKYYTLSEDLLIIKMNMICKSRQFSKHEEQNMLSILSQKLHRTSFSIQKRREKLQNLTSAQQNQIFIYVQLFPKLTQQRKLLILKNTQIIYQTIEGEIVSEKELKKIKDNLSKSKSFKSFMKEEIQNAKNKIVKREKKIKKKAKNVEDFLSQRETAQQLVKDQKLKTLEQNKVDKKLVRSFMGLYLQLFKKFPDKIVIDFTNKKIKHHFGNKQITNFNQSFFDVIEELKDNKIQLERTKESRSKKNVVLNKQFDENQKKPEEDQQQFKNQPNENKNEQESFKSKRKKQKKISSQKSLLFSEKSFSF